MTPAALLLVLTGAICHAAWNILAKRCAGGPVFVWQFGLVSLVPSVPIILWCWHAQQLALTPAKAAAVAASALLHVLYALALQRGYQSGPFSVVYPVARGSGPLLTVLAAVAVWSERPSTTGWLGVGAVLGGIVLLSGAAQRTRDPLPAPARRAGLRWGLITGALVASYTLIDAWAVKSLVMAPLAFYPLGLLLRSALLTPFVLSRREEARAHWQAHRGTVIGVGLLSPLAYTLALLALQRAPLSYVAPAREISMLLGALIGARLLGESLTPLRVAGVLMLLGGVVGIALA